MTSCMAPMWLHPLHTAGGTQPELLLPADLEEMGFDAPAKSLVAGLESLAQFMARWTGSRHYDGEPTHKVMLGERGVYIFMHLKGAASMLPMHVPLLSSCVFHAESSAACAAASSSRRPSTPLHQGRSIILVMPSSEGGSVMIPQAIGPFWLLVVDAAVEHVQGILAAMSQRGALRWDLDQAFTLTSKQLGRGSYSVVYLAHEKQVHKRCVAAKVLKTESAANEVREASFLVSVGWHPHIISFHGIFFTEAEDKGSLSWTMILGLCPRGDLHGEVQCRGPFSELAAAEVVHGLLSALVRVHSVGIVHRDVKAENVLLSEHLAPVLSDFGVAAHLKDQQAMSQRCGSPGYAAPELLTPKETYSEKVDVFGVGVVLYFLLSCMLPFSGPDVTTISRRTVRGVVPFDRPPFESVTRQMKQLIADYLKINQDDRPSALHASKLLVLAVPAAAFLSSAKDGGSSRRTSQALTDPCVSPKKTAPPSAPAPTAGGMRGLSLAPEDDLTTPPGHKSELPQRRLRPEHRGQPVRPDQQEQPLFRQRNRDHTVANGAMRLAPDYRNPGRFDSVENGGDTSQQQQQQRQSSLPSTGRLNRVNHSTFAKQDPTTQGDIGKGGSGGGRHFFRLMSFKRQPLQLHVGEDGSTPPRSLLELATASEPVSSTRSPTGSARSPSPTQSELTPDDWKSWKTESSEQLGILKLPKEPSTRCSFRHSCISNASSTATSSSIPKGYTSERSVYASERSVYASERSVYASERSVSDERHCSRLFERLPEENAPKADFGEFCTSSISKAMRPITPSRQPHPQAQTHLPQPLDQRMPPSACSADQAHQIEGQSAWNRYMPRFLLTPRRRRTISNSADQEAAEKNSATVKTAAA